MNAIEIVAAFHAESPSLLLLGLTLIAVARLVRWGHPPLSLKRGSSQVPIAAAL